MASLLDLPNEIIACIAEYLEVPGLAAWLACNRRFYALLDETLFSQGVQLFPYLLCWASHVGLIRLVQRLLDAGISPNRPVIARSWLDGNERCDTPSLTSRQVLEVYYRHWEEAKRSRVGEEYDNSSKLSFMRNVSGMPFWFPLHAASYSGHDDVVTLLISRGAKVDYLSYGFCRCDRLYSLGSNRISPFPRIMSPSWTPLHTALCGQNDPTASILLSFGASRNNDPSDEPFSAIHTAAYFGCVRTLELLVHENSEGGVDFRDHRNRTPLVHAYHGGQEHTTGKWLIQHGADVNAAMGDGYTVLHAACRFHWYEQAFALLDAGANVQASWKAPEFMDVGSVRPLELLCWCGPDWCTDLLSLPHNRPDADIDDDTRASLAARLLEHPDSLKANPGALHTPIVFASLGCVIPLLESMVSKGADVNEIDMSGLSPILAACAQGAHPWRPMLYDNQSENYKDPSEVVSWLLSHGAQVDQRNTAGDTALLIMCDLDPHIRDVLKTVSLLLDHGAAANAQNTEGNSPLLAAFTRGRHLICQTLLGRGATPSERDIGMMFRVLMHEALKIESIGPLQPQIEPVLWTPEQIIEAFDFLMSSDYVETILADPDSLGWCTRLPLFPFSEALLTHDSANVFWVSDRGDTCIHNLMNFQYAEQRPFDPIEIARQLIARGLSPNSGHPIHQAINMKQWQMVKLLLDKGATISVPPIEHSQDPLRELIAYSCGESLHHLVEQAFESLEVPLSVEQQEYYLFFTALADTEPQTLKLMKRLGFNMDPLNIEGETPLSQLLRVSEGIPSPTEVSKYIDAVKLFVDGGARLQVGDKDLVAQLEHMRNYNGDDPLKKALAREIRWRCSFSQGNVLDGDPAGAGKCPRQITIRAGIVEYSD
ncbi:ankyrin repeat-containing domain protein [Xylariales sp. PMI_506]|nr:ankyrin repeat-containing domain protein [Xylariales sp. PMI_506]